MSATGYKVTINRPAPLPGTAFIAQLPEQTGFPFYAKHDFPKFVLFQSPRVMDELSPAPQSTSVQVDRTPFVATELGKLLLDSYELVSVSISSAGNVVALWVDPDAAVKLRCEQIEPVIGASEDDLLSDEHPEEVDALATIYAPSESRSFLPQRVHEVKVVVQNLRCPILQDVPNGGFLLVDPRLDWSTDSPPPNAVLYDSSGRILARGLFGDGIQHALVTPSGQVWVGYFDEGVYAATGFAPNAVDLLSSTGLNRFAPDLSLSWRYDAQAAGRGPIDDCYALNLDGETAWVCYYYSFPLVKITRETVRSWDNPVQGANAIAISGDQIAFFGGYNENTNRLVLGRLETDKVTVDNEYEVVLPRDGPMTAAVAFGRGSNIHLIVGNEWYRLDPFS